MSRLLASSMNYFEVEITWDPPANDFRVDVYHYQVINSRLSVNASVILESNTTNTTVVIDANGICTISFVLSACNCKGASTPVALWISINGED